MKQFDTWLEKSWKKAYTLLILLALGMYAIFSLNQTVWADEAYTFALIRHSFREIWQITAADVHPPLYYFLLKVLSAPFGYPLYLCRFLSAMPVVLTLAIGGWQVEKCFGKRTALLFMGAYLLFPYAMTCAAEVRMYGLSQLFVTMCALFAYRAYGENRRKYWVLFFLFGTCAAYTHYFALVSAGIIYGLLLLAVLTGKRNLWKRWTLASVATIVLFLPWLGSFVAQLAYKVSNEYWIEPITLSTVVNYGLTLFSANGMAAFPLFFALVYGIAFVVLLAGGKKWAMVGLVALAVPLGTLAVGLLASILVRPVFVIRYLLPSVPLLVFFFAYSLAGIRTEALVASLVTVCLMGGISNSLVVAKTCIFPEENRLTRTVVASLPEYDVCVTLSGNTLHASQELSYWDPETPIYTVDVLGADNPYPNRFPYAQFRQVEGNWNRVLLVLAQGETVPAEFSDYTAEYLRDVTISEVGQSLWYLVRK